MKDNTIVFITLLIAVLLAVFLAISFTDLKYSKHYSGNPVTVSKIALVQKEWADGIIAIGAAYTQKKDYKLVAKQVIDKLYAYDFENGIVLFKPTKARDAPFRMTTDSALSYFIGGNTKFKEDKGFAIQPWIKVDFHNNKMYFHGDMAVVMGEYIFTDQNNHISKVEYTFGYVNDDHNNLKIVLHHSSLPYAGYKE